MRARFVFALAIAASLVGCAAIPRPVVLGEVEQVRHGAAAEDAKKLAPQAFAHAEKVAREASEAFDKGDVAGSQILGEIALAAYAHAEALARIARAETDTTDAGTKLGDAKRELDGLDADLQRESADADALELRIKVARDAQSVEASGKADADREKARLASARALSIQARLLCDAARLLGGTTPDPKAGLDAAEQAATALDDKLGKGATPIDEAARVRAGCLNALTILRRGLTPVSKAPGAGDALLAELGAAGTTGVSRDDRGVVVTLRDVVKGDKLTPAGEIKLKELGRVAAAHPSFPLEVVVHSDAAVVGDALAKQRSSADLVAKTLTSAASGLKAQAVAAGASAPLVDPSGKDKARNNRVEIVFVVPESF